MASDRGRKRWSLISCQRLRLCENQCPGKCKTRIKNLIMAFHHYFEMRDMEGLYFLYFSSRRAILMAPCPIENYLKGNKATKNLPFVDNKCLTICLCGFSLKIVSTKAEEVARCLEPLLLLLRVELQVLVLTWRLTTASNSSRRPNTLLASWKDMRHI